MSMYFDMNIFENGWLDKGYVFYPFVKLPQEATAKNVLFEGIWDWLEESLNLRCTELLALFYIMFTIVYVLKKA